MERSLRVSHGHARLVSHSTVSGGAVPRKPVLTTAVGASYAFDPGVDGLASIYAARVLERGIDPRALCAEIRADRLGLVDRGPQRRALMARTRTSRFGRGTAAHLRSQDFEKQRSREIISASEKQPVRTVRSRPGFQFSLSRKLAAAAGVAALLLLPLGVIVAHAQETTVQSQYVVQPGATLNSVAAEYGVDPEAILAAIAIENLPWLTPEEIFVIPDSSESPGAAWSASSLEGAGSFVSCAYDIALGETLAGTAAGCGLDLWALATFKGVGYIDTVHAGRRLQIATVHGSDDGASTPPTPVAGTSTITPEAMLVGCGTFSTAWP